MYISSLDIITICFPICLLRSALYNYQNAKDVWILVGFRAPQRLRSTLETVAVTPECSGDYVIGGVVSRTPVSLGALEALEQSFGLLMHSKLGPKQSRI